MQLAQDSETIGDRKKVRRNLQLIVYTAQIVNFQMQANLERCVLETENYEPELSLLTVDALIQPVIESMKSLASINMIKLREDSRLTKKSLVISVDKKRVQNILQNLVINTISQTNEGGKILIQIDEIGRDHDQTVLKFMLISDEESTEDAQRRFNEELDSSEVFFQDDNLR